jgi:hypothetical protein
MAQPSFVTPAAARQLPSLSLISPAGAPPTVALRSAVASSVSSRWNPSMVTRCRSSISCWQHATPPQGVSERAGSARSLRGGEGGIAARVGVR